MGTLHQLAEQYQSALGALNDAAGSAAADQAGRALYAAMKAVVPEYAIGSASQWDTIGRLITGSQLAASITAYWERISWAEVTLQQLCGADKSLPTSLQVSGGIMYMLFRSTIQGDPPNQKISPDASGYCSFAVAFLSLEAVAGLWVYL